METRETKDTISSIKIRQDRQLTLMRKMLKEQRKTNQLLESVYRLLSEEKMKRDLRP